jgi:hypothetical protein
MKNVLTSNVRRQGRACVALILAVAALVSLLGIWNGLPTVEARGPATANTGSTDLVLSSSDLITYYIFLPIVLKPKLGFSDDFSNTSSGWPHKVTFEDCYYEYYNGRYRVKVSDYGQRCIIPNFKIPAQVNGTFKVKVRRTSDEDRHMLYGFIFGAGSDATQDRWALEVYPNKDSECDDKPFFWLVALVGGETKFFKDECTSKIDTDENDWNELMVIRNGSNIKVYINGHREGNYNDASYLLNKGYFNLEVVSVSDETIYVEYDNLEITTNTVAP